jgi:hypothetical protein
LGFTLDSKLNFNKFCSDTISKAYRKWYVLRYLCPSTDGKTLLRLYKTYILPVLEFCNIVWKPNKFQENKIEKVQKKITKFISYKMNDSGFNYNERLKKLCLNTLSVRRNIKILKFTQKIRLNRESIPNDWNSRLSFVENDRTGTKIVNELIRISKCENSFFYFSSNIFNNLPINIRNETNLKVFTKLVHDFYCNN